MDLLEVVADTSVLSSRPSHPAANREIVGPLCEARFQSAMFTSDLSITKVSGQSVVHD